MRVAALYDIHGNLPALEAVLAEVEAEGVDAVVVGGDVMPGPRPGACLDRILGLTPPVRALKGNGEADVVRLHRDEAVTRVPERLHGLLRWTVHALDARHLDTVAGWPSTVRLEVDGVGDVMFCHATPRDDWEIFTRRSPEAALRPVFEPTGADVVVCGHTHMPVDRRVGRVRVVTCGSVGLPFGEPGAHWLLLGPDGVEFRRTDYDRAAALASFADTDYPGLEDFRIVDPPTEREMLDAFAPATLGLVQGRS